jgi:hypothetical protein
MLTYDERGDAVIEVECRRANPRTWIYGWTIWLADRLEVAGVKAAIANGTGSPEPGHRRTITLTDTDGKRYVLTGTTIRCAVPQMWSLEERFTFQDVPDVPITVVLTSYDKTGQKFRFLGRCVIECSRVSPDMRSELERRIARIHDGFEALVRYLEANDFKS